MFLDLAKRISLRSRNNMRLRYWGRVLAAVFVRVADVPCWNKLPSHVKEFRMTPENIQDIIACAATLRRK